MKSQEPEQGTTKPEPRATCPYCEIETEWEVYKDEQPGVLYTCKHCRVCFLDEAFAAIQNGTYQKPHVFARQTDETKGTYDVTPNNTNSHVRRQPHKRQNPSKAKAPKQLTLDFGQ